MRTREADLVALAEAAVSRRSSEMALLIDLSAVPNIDDPAFFRVLVGRLQRRAEQLDAKRFDLAHHKICFVVPASAAMALDHAVKSLSKLLTDHGKPPIDEKLFHLARRPEAFLDLSRALLKEAESTPDFTSQDDESKALVDFLAVEGSLSQADISNLLREKPIYELTDQAHPTVIAVELSTSVRAVQELYGLPLRRNPWLFDRITEILDRRMLVHLVRDRAHTARRLSINLHLSTILSEPFDRFVADPNFDWRGHLIFELSHIEMIDEPERYTRALQHLEDLGAQIAIDAIPWTSAAHMVDAPSDIRLLKFEWHPALPSLESKVRDDFMGHLDTIGRDRCVLFHCPDVKAVETARTLGFTMVQGVGAEVHAARLHDAEIDALAHKGLPPPSEPKDSEKSSGWFSKTFGG